MKLHVNARTCPHKPPFDGRSGCSSGLDATISKWLRRACVDPVADGRGALAMAVDGVGSERQREQHESLRRAERPRGRPSAPRELADRLVALRQQGTTLAGCADILNARRRPDFTRRRLWYPSKHPQRPPDTTARTRRPRMTRHPEPAIDRPSTSSGYSIAKIPEHALPPFVQRAEDRERWELAIAIPTKISEDNEPDECANSGFVWSTSRTIYNSDLPTRTPGIRPSRLQPDNRYTPGRRKGR
jgi:hypothetical protein